MIARLLAVLFALCLVGETVAAQLPTTPSRPTPVKSPRDTVKLLNRDSLKTRADTLKYKADSAAMTDTIGKANFGTADSVMQRLLNSPGYNATRYQGEKISFDAQTRAIQITNKATVYSAKDSQLVKSDTIRYAGSGDSVMVATDPTRRGNVLVKGNQAPILSSGHATYDLARKRASVQNVKTRLEESGQELTITAERLVVVMRDSAHTAADSSAGATRASSDKYGESATMTACPDSVPDYYFKVGELKQTGSFVVARPAVLYIGDVPVLWLPFLFQDIRNGRHSGLITPNLGVSDFIRNSKSYRRNVEGLGYYFAISDYMDAQFTTDWRSDAGEADFNDPGFMRYTGEFRYRWLDRFTTGNVAVSHTSQGGSTNEAISWGHQQSFSRNSTFSMNLNYVTSTTLQRNTTVNPYSALATISSQANYQQKLGPMQLSIGGSQKQYPGRSQLDRQFPTTSLTTSPLNIASWLTWTPGLNYSASDSKNIDQPSSLGLLLRTGKTLAGLDTVFGDTLRRSQHTSNLAFDSPITIFGYNLGNQFTLANQQNDFPEREIVTDVLTGVETERIYAQTYHQEFNWTPSFTVPALARNNFNTSLSLSFSNVDGGPLAVRNERTGGKWVTQTKRPTFGLSASPTLFGVFSGWGPFQRFRHSISPTVSYSYSPAAEVSDEYLAAVGRTKYSKTTGDTTGYLGALAQNSLSFGLNTNIEAKLRSRNDSNPEGGEKIKLLSVDFTSLSYDFERARFTHSAMRGLTTEAFGYTLRSDLLPGLDVGVNYSLFEGSTLSDSARFKPFRTGVTGSFQFSNTANPFAMFARLFSRGSDSSTSFGTASGQPNPDDRYAREIASQSVAGRGARSAAFLAPPTKGWQASLNFTSSRQRPITGSNVVQFDPTLQCQALNTALLRLQYEQCVASARTNPQVTTPFTSGIIGSPIYLSPPTTSLGGNVNFALTPHWAASWQTQYDFEQHDFASQIVSLSRDLHDWRAIFAFTKSPTGSFSFNFLIQLKAEPELKFDYHKSTYRNEGLTTLTQP